MGGCQGQGTSRSRDQVSVRNGDLWGYSIEHLSIEEAPQGSNKFSGQGDWCDQVQVGNQGQLRPALKRGRAG